MPQALGFGGHAYLPGSIRAKKMSVGPSLASGVAMVKIALALRAGMQRLVDHSPRHGPHPRTAESRSAATQRVAGADAVAFMWRLDGEGRAVTTVLPDPGPSRCFPAVLSADYFAAVCSMRSAAFRTTACCWIVAAAGGEPAVQRGANGPQ
jgi:hypothetical protein